MDKKISLIVVMVALLGVVQHVECKKMFKQTRAKVQKWRAGRQQKQTTKQKESRKGGFFGKFKKEKKGGLRSTEEISKMKQEASATVQQERAPIAQLKKQLAQEQEKPASQLSPTKQRQLEAAIRVREEKRDKALATLSEIARAGK